MLTESTVISAITILEDGQIQIRRSRRVFDGAEMLAEQYHRHVIVPGDDTSQEDARVKSVATLIHTSTVVADYRAARAAKSQL